MIPDEAHAPASGPHTYVVDKLAKALMVSRYLLLPMYAGLSAAMLLYCYVFFRELYHLLIDLCTGSETRSVDMILQLSTLSLLDMVMIANLIVMVAIGGYSIFVRELPVFEGAPRFLKTLTSGTLKVKMSASLVGVSAINLVRIFINIEQTSWDTLGKQLAIHVAFLVAVLVFTWMESKLHHPDTATTH